MTTRHVVSWTLIAEDPKEHAAQAGVAARRLNELDGVVPQLLSVSAGANAAYPEANADLALVADFASLAAFEEYQVHPTHQEVAGYIRSVAASRVAVDFEV